MSVGIYSMSKSVLLYMKTIALPTLEPGHLLHKECTEGCELYDILKTVDEQIAIFSQRICCNQLVLSDRKPVMGEKGRKAAFGKYNQDLLQQGQ